MGGVPQLLETGVQREHCVGRAEDGRVTSTRLVGSVGYVPSQSGIELHGHQVGSRPTCPQEGPVVEHSKDTGAAAGGRRRAGTVQVRKNEDVGYDVLACKLAKSQGVGTAEHPDSQAGPVTRR